MCKDLIFFQCWDFHSPMMDTFQKHWDTRRLSGARAGRSHPQLPGSHAECPGEDIKPGTAGTFFNALGRDYSKASVSFSCMHKNPVLLYINIYVYS